jgi:hypothetical protein
MATIRWAGFMAQAGLEIPAQAQVTAWARDMRLNNGREEQRERAGFYNWAAIPQRTGRAERELD